MTGGMEGGMKGGMEGGMVERGEGVSIERYLFT